MNGLSGFGPLGGLDGGAPPGSPTSEAAPGAAPAMRLNALAGTLPGWLGALPGTAQPGAGAEAPPAPVSRIPGFGGLTAVPGLLGGGFPTPFQPPQPPQPPTAPPPQPRPGRVPFGPIDAVPFPFPFPFPFPSAQPVSQTATQLARSAIVTLTNAPVERVEEAINTLRARSVAADNLLDYLERRVRVGEVLNQLASSWSDTTVGDFADAFQMDREKRDVMDAIVAIGILNDPQLDEEILVENTQQTSEQDLLDNRVIVDQWPPGGTVMQPPYIVLVAVEYRDVAQARDVVQAIMGELVDHTGVKLPRAAVERLRTRG